MFQKAKHFVSHSKIIKRNINLIPKIASGYYKTLVLKQNVLRTLELALLTECNSECVMCYATEMKREDDHYLTPEEYRNLWQQARKLGAFSAILSGGEPTMRKEFFEIVEALNPHDSIIGLVSNSSMLNRPFLKDLKKAGIETLHLSLDSLDEEKNDRIRGMPGHYRHVMYAIEEGKKQGFHVFLSTVIMRDGMDKMKEIVQFAMKNEIGVIFSLACVSGEWSQAKDVLLTDEEWKYVQNYMKKNNGIIRSDWTINLSMKTECPGGREKISVSPYGDIQGCGMNYVSFGNIREEPLERIWRRSCEFPDFKRRPTSCLIGADMDYIERYIRPLSGKTVPVQIDQHPTNPISFAELEGR